MLLGPLNILFKFPTDMLINNELSLFNCHCTKHLIQCLIGDKKGSKQIKSDVNVTADPKHQDWGMF